MDNAAFQHTDDAPAIAVLAAVRHCANAWEGSARLLGDVRASDIARACSEAIAALTRITGAADIVDEAACRIWSELCPDMVMGDEDRPYYEAAAKAVLALSASRNEVLEAALREAERFVSYLANETDGCFAGSGTPTTCLVMIRAALNQQNPDR